MGLTQHTPFSTSLPVSCCHSASVSQSVLQGLQGRLSHPPSCPSSAGAVLPGRGLRAGRTSHPQGGCDGYSKRNQARPGPPDWPQGLCSLGPQALSLFLQQGPSPRPALAFPQRPVPGKVPSFTMHHLLSDHWGQSSPGKCHTLLASFLSTSNPE